MCKTKLNQSDQRAFPALGIRCMFPAFSVDKRLPALGTSCRFLVQALKSSLHQVWFLISCDCLDVIAAVFVHEGQFFIFKSHSTAQ